MIPKLCCLPVLLAFSLPFSQVAGQDKEADSPADELKKILRPEHVDAMKGWDEKALEILDGLESPTKMSATDVESIAGVKECRRLLSLQRVVIPKEDDLVGNWQVRSLQAGGLGCYVYPYFKCSIKRQGKALVFEKNTGSQRRQGQLARVDGRHFLFVGASYYGYEGKPRKYSTLVSAPTEEDQNRDSVGNLYKIGKDHYLIAFTPEGERIEFYEIKR